MSSPERRCWGVIAAAGTGSRMASAVPKQYLPLQGMTVLEHSLKALLACRSVDSVVVALHARDDRAASLAGFSDPKVLRTAGGDSRCASVLAALKELNKIADPKDWVLVHDAARPCVQVEHIANLVESVRASGIGAILAEPLVDTLKRASAEGQVVQTLDRCNLWRAQTPQMFELGLLQNALEQASARGKVVTDEASAMEFAGHPVALLEGSPSNLKITLPEDLALAEYYLAARGLA